MKKIFLSSCFNFLLAGAAFSQAEFPKMTAEYTKIELSGFKVILVYSDTFSIKMGASTEAERVIKNDTLSYTIKDQTGTVPKRSIMICTNTLEYLSLHNCKLDMRSIFKIDTLSVVTAASTGELKVNANDLSINCGGGSSFSISGTAAYFSCAVSAGSSVDASGLSAEKGEINAMGQSSLVTNIKNILKKEINNAEVKNISK